jgi:hypothetical protein
MDRHQAIDVPAGKTALIGEPALPQPAPPLPPSCFFRDVTFGAFSQRDGEEYLLFTRGEGGPPPELAELRQDIENMNAVIVLAFKDDPAVRQGLLRHLLLIAQTSLCGSDWNVALGRARLDLFQETVIDRANQVRSRFIRKIGLFCLLLVAASLAAMFYLWLFLSAGPESVWQPVRAALDGLLGAAWEQLAYSFLFAMLGVALAISLSAIMRLRSIKLDLLGRFDPYVFGPVERIAYTVLIAITVMLLLGFDVVTIGVGPAILNDFPSTPILGVLIGLLAGFSEPLLAGIIETSLVPRQPAKADPAP